jgi:hypothetical protein
LTELVSYTVLILLLLWQLWKVQYLLKNNPFCFVGKGLGISQAFFIK